jgi:multiple sugar transport system permease protein
VPRDAPLLATPPATRRRARLPAVAYLFLAPWLFGFFILTAGPMLASLYLSFTAFDLLTAPRWIGLANYERMFGDDRRFWAAVEVTFRYVLFSVPLKLAFALMLAIFLDRGLRGLSFYRSVLYLPSLLGGSVAIAVLWRQIFGFDGLINEALWAFGIQGPSWISHPDHALDTLIALRVWQFGSPMVIFLAGLRQIPTELYEAAAIDGARAWQRFRRITLPLLAPVVFFNLILQTIDAFKAFTPAFIISSGTGGPVDSTLFFTLYLYQEGFGYFRMGYASALAWFLFVVIGVFTAAAFLTSRYWVHYEDGRR